MYTAVKYVHVISVALSLSGFFFRGLLMMLDSPLLGQRWIRRLPHVNDTILLVAALMLAWMSGQYPFVADWVTAKIFGVIVYIILGALALRDASTRRMRIACWVAALAVFAWISSVALTRDPAGIFARLAWRSDRQAAPAGLSVVAGRGSGHASAAPRSNPLPGSARTPGSRFRA